MIWIAYRILNNYKTFKLCNIKGDETSQYFACTQLFSVEADADVEIQTELTQLS